MVNFAAVILAVCPLGFLFCDISVIWITNLKLDPVYLLFVYFFPPGSEVYQNWYSPLHHALVCFIVGIPYVIEGGRTIAYCLMLGYIIPPCIMQYLHAAAETVSISSGSLRVSRRLKMGIKLYDRYCILQHSERGSTSTNSIIIYGLGYVIIMINAAAIFAAWDHLPIEVIWMTLVITLMGIGFLTVPFPATTELYTFAESMLREWKNIAKFAKTSASIRRQVTSRIPVGLYFGDFRPLNNEFRLAYLESLMERTSNQILIFKSGRAFSL